MTILSDTTVPTNTPVWVRVSVVSSLLLWASCGGTTPVQPSPPQEQLQISCPRDRIVDASRPEGADLQFDAPVPAGGRAPYTIECTPGAGTVIPLGETTVRCTATAADTARAACSFTVRVRVAQTLSRSRFTAFGDSISWGAVSLAPVLRLGAPDTYPYKLEQMLRQRYPTQTFVVSNQGVPGERTVQGVQRLPSVLNVERPEVLLLLEGVNGVGVLPIATQEGNLRTMVAAAQQRRVDVIIATLMPVALNGRIQPATEAMAAIVALNARIRSLANERDFGSVVDLFALFEANMHLLGSDGVHPTLEGQTRIAEAFRDEIVRRYENRSTLTLGVSAVSQR